MSSNVGPEVVRDRERLPTALRRALTEWHPPVRTREFWAVQGLVMLLAITHALVEGSQLLGEHSSLALLPPALYFIPVVYAAVHFGLRGSLLTAILACILVVPNVLMWHEGLEVVGEAVQMVWIVLVAVFVGVGVDRERDARLEAERREQAWRLSEARYRLIFEAAAEPIVVVDDQRRVEAANPAAGRLFGRSSQDLRGHELPGALGAAVIASVNMTAPARDLSPAEPFPVVSDHAHGRAGTTWIQPVAMAFTGPDGTARTQLMLLDVTAGHEREQGLREMARHMMRAREEEGQRIARELHDGPIQTLVALWRALDELEEHVAPDDAVRLRRARVSAETVAQELRRVSRDLRPSVLDDLGIAAAIQAEAAASGERTGLEVEVTVSGPSRRLEPDVELALLRISQEALRNVERHAGATRVAISLSFRRDDLELMVADDGRGIDPLPTTSALLASDHLGLIGMRERARLVGGSMELSRSAMGGLCWVVRIPTSPIESRPDGNVD
jgi:signal transduction histidine kinase